jgi:anionic cell wall polymer biosynthesis LytR-Cps2A-Psr (LCP) family protein
LKLWIKSAKWEDLSKLKPNSGARYSKALTLIAGLFIVSVPSAARAQQAMPAPLAVTKSAATTTPVNAEATPQPSPTIGSTAAPVLDLSAFPTRRIPVPSVPVTATTGIVPSDAFSLTTAPPPVPAVRLPAGTVNIALLGVDTRPKEGSLLSDVIIIASINPYAPAVTLLSIPRDTLVYIPGYRMTKVNVAFSRGPEVFRQTIKYNFGLDVHYYAAVNFAGLVNAVNILGGIEIVATCPIYQVFPKDPYYLADPATPLTVTTPYTDAFTGEVWEVGQRVPTLTLSIPRAGVYRLDGLQALAYVRARYGVPGGDVDRTRRAQRVVRALLNQARQKGILAVTRLPALYDQFKRYVRTDLTLEQILSLALQADRLDDAVIRSRFLDAVGMVGATIEPVGSVLIPKREDITPYLQRALSVSLNQREGEGIPVEVWNATGRRSFGLAAAERLRELGFKVVDVQDVSEVFTQTQIVDFTTTKKGSALPRLQRALNVRPENVSAQPSPGGPSYRIIAGQDFEACYYKTTPANISYVPRPTPSATPNATPALKEAPKQDE